MDTLTRFHAGLQGLVMLLLLAGNGFGQETVESPAQITDQAHWVSNEQLFSVLSLDYQVQAAQGWLIVINDANQFFVQANPQFPEIRMMQAWGNTVNVSLEELNMLNNRLTGGRLFLTEENKINLIVEHSYHGMKMNSIGLVKCIERFCNIRDQVVKMIYEL